MSKLIDDLEPMAATDVDADMIAGVAVRLTDRCRGNHTEAERMAIGFAQGYPGGTVRRRFWLDVADSIRDAAPDGTVRRG